MSFLTNYNWKCELGWFLLGHYYDCRQINAGKYKILKNSNPKGEICFCNPDKISASQSCSIVITNKLQHHVENQSNWETLRFLMLSCIKIRTSYVQ